MYKKILVPTDGSELSIMAAKKGVQFAKEIAAEVVVIYVAPEYQYPVYVEIIPPTYPSDGEYRDAMKKSSMEHIEAITDFAKELEVSFTSTVEFSDSTAEKIVEVTNEQKCDLIYIGSNGRTGISRFFLGSVTTRVLALSSQPVLVDRLVKEA